MAATLTIIDEATSGERGRPFELLFPSSEITVRELIRERVYQEVKDHNARTGLNEPFRGLVQPTEAEMALNGTPSKAKRMIDWEPQYEVALKAFEQSRVLVLVDARQVESLDETIHIAPRTEVVFLKLTPLVGG